MIKHIVMFKFKDEAEGKTKRENAVIAKNMLDSLFFTRLFVPKRHKYLMMLF